MKSAKPVYPRIVVMVDKFSHDVNGNPNGHHTVYAYRDKTSNITNPAACLYESKRRSQVGYSNNYDDNAPDAVRKAGLNMSDYVFVRKENDRSEGFVNLIYDLKTDNTPADVDATTKRYIEAEMLQACPLPAEKNGQIRMQLQSEHGKTKWLNVSPEQFRAIEKIMMGE